MTTRTPAAAHVPAFAHLPTPAGVTGPGGGGPSQPRTCFVIGPIGDGLADHDTPARQSYDQAMETFEEIIQPACESLGIEPVRADQITQSGEISEQIFRHLLEAEVVIADLTGANPNVTYELALRHLTGRAVIHISEHGQLPFDIAAVRTILFKRTPNGLAGARRQLAEVLTRTLDNGFTPLAPARILFGLGSADDGTDGDGEPTPRAGGGDPVGLMERFADVEEGMAAMSEDITAMTVHISAVAALFQEFFPELQRGGAARVQLAVTLRLSRELTRPAAELKVHAGRFAGRMNDIDAAVHAALDLFETAPPTLWQGQDRAFLTQIIDMAVETRGGAETLQLFRTLLQMMIAMSRQLKEPCGDIIAAVELLTGTARQFEAWEQRARALVARVPVG
ncbi:hypothetical protein ABT093_22635 [Kitasatospora sp. NPDC002551]|uniref:hypothetical protein n=1 Tax=Kitasatospora sp. NPDC002551 TaxID=3154539 RepID=UPI003323E52E